MSLVIKLLSFLAAVLLVASQAEGYYLGDRQLKSLLSRQKVTGHEIKRRSNVDSAVMDKVLQDELQYAQQLASGIITDLRSLLVDIKRDPSDPDRLLRLS